MFCAARLAIVSLTLVSVAACADHTPLEPGRTPSYVGATGQFVAVIPRDPTQFVSISSGLNHACARQAGGDVYCWGAGDNTQVGTSTFDPCQGECVFAPTFILNAAQIDASGNRTCALGAAGRPAGATNALCWGGGHGFIKSWVYGSLDFRSISAGGGFNSCGPTSAGIQCWDFGSVASIRWGGSFYGQTAVTGSFGCAIETGGGSFLDCWGDNSSGQTAMDPSQFPSPQTILRTPLGSAVTHVSTGGSFTCADQSAGIVNCFGVDDLGQLGFGVISAIPGWTFQVETVSMLSCAAFTGCSLVPAPLHGVSAGVHHACALDTSGAAFCWGDNRYGQLGNGTKSSSAFAIAIAGGHTFRAIAAGYTRTCAIGTDNVIYCWGTGTHGELGTGVASDVSLFPKPTAALRLSVPAP